MKIRDIITEAEERNLDRELDRYFQDREAKKKKAAKMKSLTDRPGLGGTIAKGIQRGNRWYDKIKDLATAKIPGA